MPCGVQVHVPHINMGGFSSGTHHCLQTFLYKVNPTPSMTTLPRDVLSANQGSDFLIGRLWGLGRVTSSGHCQTCPQTRSSHLSTGHRDPTLTGCVGLIWEVMRMT